MESSYLAQAITQCEEVILTATEQPEEWQAAFKNLGNLLQGRAEFNRAIVWHSLALDSELNLAEVYSQLGELHLLENNLPAARYAFEHALEFLPNSARVYAALAQINSQLQHKEAEIECWYKATQINPKLVTPQGFYKLAKALEQRGKITEAIACFEKAATGDKAIVNAFYDLGEIYQRQGKLAQAQTSYRQIIALLPTEARAHHKLGTIFLQQRVYDEAIECFRQAIKIAPEFPWSYHFLVKTFLATKKYDEAISTCYAILNLVEEYPWVYSLLGFALREKGRIPDAVNSFQKACAHRGWQDCVAKDYFFTFDNFSHRLEFLTKHLQPLAAQKIKAVEVGTYQGMSSCWLLDQILTHPQSTLTCIDTKFIPKFRENIVKTRAEAKVQFAQGPTHQLLAALPPQSFDLINLQDQEKVTQHCQENARLAWELTKPEGFIIFSYYGWRDAKQPQLNPKQGIDRFLESVPQQWRTVHLAPAIFQLIIQKL